MLFSTVGLLMCRFGGRQVGWRAEKQAYHTIAPPLPSALVKFSLFFLEFFEHD